MILPQHEDVNEGHVAGHLASDADPRWTTKGKAVVTLTVVTKHEKQVEFHRLVCSEKDAQAASRVKKGDFLRAVGRIATRSWIDKRSGEKRYTTEIIVLQLEIPPEQQPLTPDFSRGAAGGGDR